MITGELKNKVDDIWTTFWSNGFSNPITIIEQMTYLLFMKGLDDAQMIKERNVERFNTRNKTNKVLENPFFGENEQQYRWHKFKQLDPENKLKTVLEAFEFIKNKNKEEDENKQTTFTKYIKSAMFAPMSKKLLDDVITKISKLYETDLLSDKDAKGDLYEYLLSKMATAGTNGQFRTPRHIIRMMVELMQPTLSDTICDPSAGTSGFLVESASYINEHYEEELLEKESPVDFYNQMFNGTEFDPTMVRIGAMNLMLHGIDNPKLDLVDALSNDNSIKNAYSLILANPPFKGSLDSESVEKSLLKISNTKKTELLFLSLMLRELKIGGRCAVVVPDGVLFGSSNAHKTIRKEIVENQLLQAVISMPSGVFKPYAGVSTAILIFTKSDNGGTENVWFYDMQADGYSLDDKRQKVAQNDIPDIITRFHSLETEQERKRTEKSFLVPKAEIAKNEYDLSINRYKEIVYEEITYRQPKDIILSIKELQNENNTDLQALEGLLG